MAKQKDKINGFIIDDPLSLKELKELTSVSVNKWINHIFPNRIKDQSVAPIVFKM